MQASFFVEEGSLETSVNVFVLGGRQCVFIKSHVVCNCTNVEYKFSLYVTDVGICI